MAIQPDEIVDRNGNLQSYSRRWKELAELAGMQVRDVDVYRSDGLAQLEGVQGFMWRCGPTQRERQLAKRVIPALEQGAGVYAFPSWRTIWHLEDKLAQYYLLSAAGIPMPETSILWERESALSWCRDARYSFVFKLSYGYRSTNVVLVHSKQEAVYWVEQMFGPGLLSLGYRPTGEFGALKRRVRAAGLTLLGRNKHVPNAEASIEHGYFYAQEFLSNSAFDTRVTIIGNRAFGYRRMNRPGDGMKHPCGPRMRCLPTSQCRWPAGE